MGVFAIVNDDNLATWQVGNYTLDRQDCKWV